MRYDNEIVQHSLLQDVDLLVHEQELKPDFIVFTGDIASTAQSGEYELAKEFFDQLLHISALLEPRIRQRFAPLGQLA